MTEDKGTIDLHKVLDLLEDNTLNKPVARSQNYRVFQNVLDSGTEINMPIINRLLAVCVHDLQEDKKYSLNILKIINSILNNVKAGAYSTLPNLLSSLLAVLNITKTIALMSKVETLPMLCFETILSYPDNVVVELGSKHAVEVAEVLNLYCHQRVPLEIKLLPCGLIHKLLKTMPQDKRKIFVKDLLPVWFNKLIPTIVSCVENETINNKPLETLELLTNELVYVNYAEDPHWQTVFECIYNPNKYPSTMKSMLENGSKSWHRLWIVFIKLLKNQITKSNNPIGSPINSMLPVVEMAFKLDVMNRCRAFQCWGVLIDNFSTETNEAYIVKRLKLLIIPLKSNNAKVEETALEKFNTWWHLICRFQTKLEKFTDMILISFLHFCFGKEVSQKTILTPGLMSYKTKQKSVEALLEIAGHLNCDCGDRSNIPKLNSGLINKNLLKDYWNDWKHALTMSITIANNKDNNVTTQQIVCLWTSYLMHISEITDEIIRTDLFEGLLTQLQNLLKEPEPNNNYADLIMDLLSVVFSNNFKDLLKTKGEKGPMHTIVSMLMGPSFTLYYRRNDIKQIILKLKQFSNYIMDGSISKPAGFIDWMLGYSLPQANISYLWTALSESMVELKKEEGGIETVLWPLKPMKSFMDPNYSSLMWFKLFDFLYPKIKDNEEIVKFLHSTTVTPANIMLKFYATVVVSNHESAKLQDSKLEKHIEMLMEITNKMDDYNQVSDIFPSYVDTLIAVMKITTKVSVAKNVFICINNLFRLITPLLQNNLETEILTTKMGDLLQHIEALLKKKTFSALSSLLIDELIKWAPTLHDKSLKVYWLAVLQNSLSNIKDTSILKNMKVAIESTETVRNNLVNDNEQMSVGKNFAAPNVKSAKKPKRKEASIVNTVIENGEEFVVVKSNWKFNPRKLTENQKEKLQRKRDIPALYQDLSQSQDEFKLTTWKTESQDMSSTSTKSTSVSESTNADVTNILKNIPSSDVVPKIIENIISENTKKDTGIKTTVDNKIKETIATPTEGKSPRMALKDRVFRNVRNLIEKSGLQKDGKDLSKNLAYIGNITKTPIKLKDSSNLINSAPPNLNTERPSRVKRKPKKFDDTEVFPLKRGRRSLSQQDSQNDGDLIPERSYEKPREKPDEANDGLNIDSDGETTSDPLPVSCTIDSIDDIKIIDNIIDKANKENCADDLLSTDIKPKEDKVLSTVEATTEVTTPQNTLSDVNDKFVMDTNNKPVDSKTDILNRENEDDSCANIKNIKTPKSSRKLDQSIQKSSIKRGSAKKSRIEKELAIDTVEGHPFLKIQTEKRITRKNINSPLNNSRRKALHEKLNKSNQKTGAKNKTPNAKKKEKTFNEEVSVTVSESQDLLQKESKITDDYPLSEDIIESSQDSTFSALSVTSSKNSLKKLSVVVEKVPLPMICDAGETQSLITIDISKQFLVDHKNVTMDNDIEISRNKTATVNTELDSTENMDTQPIDSQDLETRDNSSDVVIINDDEMPIVINTDNTCVGLETQEVAGADTEPTDFNDFLDKTSDADNQEVINSSIHLKIDSIEQRDLSHVDTIVLDTDNDMTQTIDLSETINKSVLIEDANTASSPFKDEEQRKKDFLDNTLEISPIKTMSPVREKKSPSPETSSDYVVIKLTSPVQSNGEPYEKCNSPEIFTEEKTSPDKRDLSPPREETNGNNNRSPSSSLSLKKNRPQVRAGGRAAQMLGLCVPDRLHTIMNAERTESEEPKKSSPSNTPARRNLRILYNSVADNSSSENSEEIEDSESFLKLKRSLPTSDCSPSVPILKRKLVEIADDATISPASKRKRVSFHDPPVSTTISVQKYIEPGGLRSPQNTVLKRLERQNLRSQATIKSAKRLDNVFKLDSVLTKTVESFTDIELPSADQTQSLSLEETPAAEIVKTSDLNDTDPICPELIECKDPIDNIAIQLSSPSMQTMLLKELEGKIATVGDIARLTELEVNRLCIKAPKIKVVQKVLSDYKSKAAYEDVVPIIDAVQSIKEVGPEVSTEKTDIETQTTDIVSKDTEMQTVSSPMNVVGVQTDKNSVSNAVEVQTDIKIISSTSSQTNDSGYKTTKDTIASCLAERSDFVLRLGEDLEESCKVKIANTLPFNVFSNEFMKKLALSDSREILNRILDKHDQSNVAKKDGQLSFLQDYMSDRFDSKDLIMFCSQLLAKIHSK